MFPYMLLLIIAQAYCYLSKLQTSIDYILYNPNTYPKSYIYLKSFIFQMIDRWFDVSEVPLSSQDPHFSSEDIHIMRFKPKPGTVK